MNIKISMVLALLGIMTLCLAVTKPLANQAFAKISCESLTLKANPGSVAHTPPEGTVQDLTGQLICGDKGNPDAVIRLVAFMDGASWWEVHVKTDSSGKFELAYSKINGLLVASPHVYTITAKYVGDGIHETANPARITITTTPHG